MIDIAKAKIAFKDFLEEYKDKSDLGFELKIVHTYHVAENAKKIAEELNLGKEDIELAELIGILHDIGRFEELKITKKLNSVKFDHAGHGSKMLFEKGMIRKFIEDNQYDGIIKKAIENHSKLKIEDNLDERTLLHSKIIRDADKIDNYRVKKDEKVEAIFPKRVNKIEDMEKSKVSDIVYNTILNQNESYQINDEDDPYYKLSIYWELEDEEIIECLDLIEENLKNGEYSFKLFPKMIRTFSSIENLNFQVDKIKELINIMKEQILKGKVQYMDWHTMIEDPAVVEIYNKNIKDLKDAINQKEEEEKEIEINEIINDNDWGIKLNDYCYERKDEFLNDRMFLAKLNIDKIINNIINSNSKNIYHFKYCIDRVYRFSNLKEFYEKDIPNFQKLIKELEKMNKDEYGVTKKEAIEYLTEISKEKLKILNGE